MLVIAVILTALVTAPGLAESQTSPEQLLSLLRQGRCVVYIRHTQTDRSRDDAIQPDLADCSTQRNLSRAGERDADELGVALQELRIPVGEVYSSPYCRAKETAGRVFTKRKFAEIEQLGRLSRMPTNTIPACNAKLKELLSRTPKVGVNDFIVGHQENLAAVGGPGIDEGGLAIFRPEQRSYVLMGYINPKQWRELAGTGRAKR